MPIAKLSVAQLKGMDLDQMENLAKGAKVLRDASLKGKTNLRFTNDVGMNCKVQMSEVFAKYASLGKTVHFEEMDQYIALGKKLHSLESVKAPSAPKSVAQKFVTALRAIFEKIFGNTTNRETRLKGYAETQNLYEGLQKAKLEQIRKEKSEKNFDEFMENVEGFKPEANSVVKQEAKSGLRFEKPLRNFVMNEQIPGKQRELNLNVGYQVEMKAQDAANFVKKLFNA